MTFPPNLAITNSFITDSTSSIFHSPLNKHKMSGYSRIEKSAANRSKSVDYAEISLTRSASNNSKSVEFQQTAPDPIKLAATRDLTPENDGDGVGEVFGDILGRKYGGGASGRFVAGEWESAAAKRSFSVKRSASVSYGYSRIHHQAAEDGDRCGDELIRSHSSRFVKKKGKLFRSVRRLFGL